jgi:hypothetical protein
MPVSSVSVIFVKADSFIHLAVYATRWRRFLSLLTDARVAHYLVGVRHEVVDVAVLRESFLSTKPSVPSLVPYEGMRLWCIHNGMKPFGQCTDLLEVSFGIGLGLDSIVLP